MQLAQALKQAERLTLLDLGGNNLGPDGLSAVSAALKGHSKLRTLDLASNPIGDAGARALSDVVKYDLQASSQTLMWASIVYARLHGRCLRLRCFLYMLGSACVRHIPPLLAA